METWKEIPGFEGLYEASDHGRVRSTRGHVLAGYVAKHGYVRHLLRRDGMRKCVYAHQAVAMAFHGVPDDDRAEVNHIAFDRSNSRPENLEWVTRSSNVEHSWSRKRRLFHDEIGPLVDEICRRRRSGELAKDIAISLGMPPSTVSRLSRAALKESRQYRRDTAKRAEALAEKKAKARQLYRQGHSLKEIAELAGIPLGSAFKFSRE